MGSGLVFTGKIQVDIRNLITAEAKEGLKRNVKTILLHSASAVRTILIRQICTAVKLLRHIQNRLFAVGIGAAVVRREGVDLCYSGQIGDN